MSKLLTIKLTEQEACALSLAAIHDGPSKHRPEHLESARKKLRMALDGISCPDCGRVHQRPKGPCVADQERWIALEC